MQLIQASIGIIDQLEEVIHQISEEDFKKPSIALSLSTVGQHLRHTLEFFVCLENGISSGLVNYDKRAHDKMVESDKFVALQTLKRIKDFVAQQREDRVLRLEVGYERGSNESVTIVTNYFRELTYNIEHSVHHMAIMKIGLREVAPYVSIPADFGVAVSTLRHHDNLAHAH